MHQELHPASCRSEGDPKHVRHRGLNCIDWEVSAGQERVVVVVVVVVGELREELLPPVLMQVLQSFHMDSLLEDARTAARIHSNSQDQAARTHSKTSPRFSASLAPSSLSSSTLVQLQRVRHLPLLVLEVSSCHASSG